VSDNDSLGNLGNYAEWYVILKTMNVRQGLLRMNELAVGDQVFMIGEPYKHVKTVWLLNLPPSIPGEDIQTIASNRDGTVLWKKKWSLAEPFWGFFSRVKGRTLEKVLPESGFCEKPMEPFTIPFQKRFSLTVKIPYSNGFS
jgi:hypothetical protein